MRSPTPSARFRPRLEAQFGRAVGCPFGNFAAELSTTDDDLRTHLAGVLGAMERHLGAACHDAAAAGILRDGTDPDRLAHALLAQYQGIILLAKLNDSGVDALAPALHEFIDGYLVDELSLCAKFGRKVMRNFSFGSTPTPATRAPIKPRPGHDAIPHPSPRR